MTPATTYDLLHQPTISHNLERFIEINPKFSKPYLIRAFLKTKSNRISYLELENPKLYPYIIEQLPYSSVPNHLRTYLENSTCDSTKKLVTAKLINLISDDMNNPALSHLLESSLTALFNHGHTSMQADIDSLVRMFSLQDEEVEPNTTKLKAIMGMIKLNPHTWYQGNYHTPCGTAHCFAGHAQLLSGKEADTATAEADSNSYLGINGEFLYEPNRTMADLERIVNAICYSTEPPRTFIESKLNPLQ